MEKADVGKLSHWDRVAFAGRCAEISLPLYQRYAPSVESEYTATLTRALRLVAESVRAERAEPSLAAEIGSIWEAAGAVLEETDAKPNEHRPTYSRNSVISSQAAKAVEMAVEAALADAEFSTDPAWSALHFAYASAMLADDAGCIELLDRLSI